jgi:hypothetical protein
MKSKLISLLSVLFLSITFTTAQYTDKISFGILGGVNFQNLYGQDFNGNKLGNELILGFHAGVNVQVPIVREFYFQPGVLFSAKGAKKSGDTSVTTTNLSYIEVPLSFVYKDLLGKGYIFLGLGPYIGYGFMGKVKTESGVISRKKEIEFENVVENDKPLTVPYYKAFDLGGNIFFGYEMELGIFAQLNIQAGMLNINPEYNAYPDDKRIIRNTGFGFSFGYRF